MTKQIQLGHRNLKPGQRVAQSRSLQYFSEEGKGFPWEVVETWDCGRMAKLEWVGYDGQESGGSAHAVLTDYLVKEYKQSLTSEPSFVIFIMWLREPLKRKENS